MPIVRTSSVHSERGRVHAHVRCFHFDACAVQESFNVYYVLSRPAHVVADDVAEVGEARETLVTKAGRGIFLQ